jgi:hypothetical protein
LTTLFYIQTRKTRRKNPELHLSYLNKQIIIIKKSVRIARGRWFSLLGGNVGVLKREKCRLTELTSPADVVEKQLFPQFQ